MTGRRAATRGWATGITAAVLALACTVPSAAAAQESGRRPIDETRAISASGTVQLEATARTVRIAGWDRSEVRVRGAMNPDVEEFGIEGDGETVSVYLRPKDDGYRGHDPSAYGPLTVSVPRGASVAVEVVSGELAVRDVEGEVSLESVSGSVRYSGGATSVEAEVVSGDITLEAPRAREVRAGSVSGDLVLRVAGGEIEAETVSGDLDVRASGSVRELRAESVSGTITFEGALSPGAELDFESHSGDVVVHLPSSVAAVLEAETFSGSIESAFGGEVRQEGEFTPEKSYRRTVGAGGARVTAETFSGSVRFRRGG